MKLNIIMKTVFFSVFVISFFRPISGYCQNAFETAINNKLDSLVNFESTDFEESMLYPNDAQQGIMIPLGWGGYGTYLFGGVGGSYPEVYTDNQLDLITTAGVSVGNPEKFANFAASVNMTSPKRFTNFSANVSVSRSVFWGSSITIGGLQLFASDSISDAPDPTFFIAFSHSVQTMPSKTPDCSSLTYTVGIGSGRFALKSEEDILRGKGKYGTFVFGGISYEIFQHVNVNAEWSGMNLGFSLGIRPFKTALSFGIGVTDLTNYSSDKPSAIFSIGFPLSLNKYKY